jgi:hyperosmotically inducible protein
MKANRTTLFTVAAAITMLAVPALATPKAPLPLADRVRHELAMLPYLNVFDDLSFRIDGNAVTLFGAVTQPVLKRDAENIVKHLEGVARVSNQIEVLPLSPMDDRIRISEYRTLYAPLQRYFLGAQPSIRIIVKNGHVTLMGVVSSEFDKRLASVRAGQVPLVFSVTNDLVVQK